MQLQGANAILTGASRGLGVHIARALARQGVNLTLAARSKDELERVREEVAATGVRVAGIPTDVGSGGQLEALVEQAKHEIGPTDILINNAGIEMVAPYHDYPSEEIEAVVRVNLLAPMLLTRLVLPGMLKRRRGHIVNVASLAGKTGFPYEAPYSATKAGLIQFTHTLRAELVDAPVRVSAIAPGFVAEDGMYARMAEQGYRASKVVGETTPRKVTEAVLKALRKGSSELIVNPSPMRPLVVLAQIAPDLVPRFHKLFGVTALARRAAMERSRERI